MANQAAMQGEEDEKEVVVVSLTEIGVIAGEEVKNIAEYARFRYGG